MCSFPFWDVPLGTLDAFSPNVRKEHSAETLDFCFGFEADLAILQFDGIFDAVAAILLADLRGLLLNKRRETFDVA